MVDKGRANGRNIEFGSHRNNEASQTMRRSEAGSALALFWRQTLGAKP